ncbi:RNA polymerase, sigma-24 subunit, ECF subfamily [Kangiella sediminilitoris]|uniref:RNA polymerase, sigma-24 subunit, ECF subfamily n=1 Tax=Kangiella sediminilitoris TaxID=1144748 RepID=A0A1B3BDF8_9GAMM|nr:RNA polymerase, sigma-24 subunit, ECF subfamily [Kangiella sediminilitoris]
MKTLAQTNGRGQYKTVNDSLYVKATPVRDSAGDSGNMKDTAISDEALMAGYASGNIKAFEKLYLRHKDPLLRFFLRQVSRRDEAEELFQDTWQRLIKHSKAYKSSAKFTTYLYHIARNRLIDHYRALGRQQEFTQDFDGWEDDNSSQIPIEPEHLVQQEEHKHQFLHALEQLPALQREVVIMKLETGMTVNDIAEVVQEKPEAVKSRLRYGLDKLKHYLRELNPSVVEGAS